MDLFEAVEGRTGPPTREDFLFRWFGEPFNFEPGHGKTLRFVPSHIGDGVIAGVVARWQPKHTNANPTNPFEVVDSGEWVNAAFFFNISDDEQVFGIEEKQLVGKHGRVVAKLCEKINEMSAPAGYKIDVRSINTINDFWTAVTNYSAPITTLSFDLVVPNPPDTTTKTKEALRKLKEKINTNSVKETFGNPEGLDLDNDFIRDREEYASSGGGDVVAKSEGAVVYSSKNNVKSIEIDEQFRPDGSEKDGLDSVIREKLRR